MEAANDTPGKEEVKAYDGYDKTSKGSSQTKKKTLNVLLILIRSSAFV